MLGLIEMNSRWKPSQGYLLGIWYYGPLEILLQNNSVISLIINANQIFTSKQKWQ